MNSIWRIRNVFWTIWNCLKIVICIQKKHNENQVENAFWNRLKLTDKKPILINVRCSITVDNFIFSNNRNVRNKSLTDFFSQKYWAGWPSAKGSGLQHRVLWFKSRPRLQFKFARRTVPCGRNFLTSFLFFLKNTDPSRQQSSLLKTLRW